MKKYFLILITISLISCDSIKEIEMKKQTRIIFLHHSTGNRIWRGALSKIADKLGLSGDVEKWFNNYNKKKNVNYIIKEREFPKASPYGWNNFPFDYYNIWVKNAGSSHYLGEPTLELLTKDYDVIIFKHCFPVSNMQESNSKADINSPEKTLNNYKLQYQAIKKKLLEFRSTKFLIWTPTAQLESQTNINEAQRAREFYEWVKNVWDTEGDNIFLWDFRKLQTEESLFFKDEYAETLNNSHPNKIFSSKVYPYFCKRIVDVIENRGDSTSRTGI